MLESSDSHRHPPASADRKRRVCLLITDAGGGHRAAADAIASLMTSRHPSWEVEIINVYREIDPTGATGEDFYNHFILRNRWTNLLWTPMVPLVLGTTRLLSRSRIEHVRRYWSSTPADMVVSLTPFVNWLLCAGIKAAQRDIRYTTVVTDLGYCPPLYWLTEAEDDVVFCPTPQIAAQCRAQGKRPEQIVTTSGVVLHSRFHEAAAQRGNRDDRQRTLRALGLEPDRTTGLVLFGAAGSWEMKRLAERLDQCEAAGVQLIFVCGRNERLRRTLEATPARVPRAVLGFSQEVPEIMGASDFFIGKPGPGSICEALLMGLPIIVEGNVTTMPQERDNCRWLEANGYGIVLKSYSQIASTVDRLVGSDALRQLKANVATYRNTAVFETVHALEALLDQAQPAAIPAAPANSWLAEERS